MNEQTDRIEARGRHFGVKQFGRPDGDPVLYCHGWPGSRLEAERTDVLACQRNLRIIAYDRPGIGLSDPLPQRMVHHTADDAAAIMEALGIGSTSVLGISGGGPHALACAACMPDSIRRVVTVCSPPPLATEGNAKICLNPLYRYLAALQLKTPYLGNLAMKLFKLGLKCPGSLLLKRTAICILPAPDRKTLCQKNCLNLVGTNVLESMRQGTRTLIEDGMRYLKDWGVPLENIECPVHLWHGKRDKNISPKAAEILAKSIPHASIHYMPEEGHYSLPLMRCAEILDCFKMNN